MDNQCEIDSAIYVAVTYHPHQQKFHHPLQIVLHRLITATSSSIITSLTSTQSMDYRYELWDMH